MNIALSPDVPDTAERATQSVASVACPLAERETQPVPGGPARYMRRHGLRSNPKPSRRRRRSQGAQLVEFTLNFLPFMIMIVVLVDTSWAIYAESTLQQAVRMAVRTGVTLTSTQVTTTLTDTVKSMVQQHAVGLLNGSTGLGYIKVHYFDANNPSSDVSNQTWGNNPGNIMRVSVENYPLVPLMPRFFNWKGGVDNNPMNMTVYAADVIEPMATYLTPPIGSAP